ncbi:ribonuclease H-like domain-containing protein [Tanacetum coccineum]
MSNNGTNVTLPNPATVTRTVTGPNIASIVPTPHAFYASIGTSLGPNPTPPPGFPLLAQAHLPSYGYTATSTPTHLTPHAARPVNTSGQATLLPQAFTAGTLHDPTTGAWNMDTGASSYLNNYVTSLSTILNSCMYSTISVGDGHSIPVINTGHNILSTPLKYLRLNNVLITPHIDFMTRRVLLRCDSTRDLYPVTAPSPIPSAFLVSQQTWHQRLGHPGREVMRRLVSNNVISCNKEKPPCSLYGLKQAPRAWFQRFASYITRVGFHHSRCDTSLFIYRQGLDTAYLLLYVDDIVLTTSSSDLLQRIIHSLHQEFAMTDLGPLNYFLGVSVTRDSSGLFLSQKKYAVELLEKAHMVNCNPSRTPVDIESKLGADGDPVSDLTLYRSLAGSLQYLTFTRPDISYVVQQVCLHMHDPREPHFSALKRILRYVQGTLHYGLQLFSSSITYLVAYSDADWAGCPTTRRSTSGYCVFLGNNLLSWSSKRQPTIFRSSANAEYRGVANVVAETCWLRNLLRELHTSLSSATLVYCDNVSAVYLSCNRVQHQRTKHIKIDIHFVRDLVAVGQVRVLHVPSRYQFADIFTKGLPSALFEEFRSSLSVRCPPAPTAEEC